MAFVGGALTKSLLEGGTSVLKMLANKELLPYAGRALAIGLPTVAAMQLMDLTPTGEVLGTYIKNKLVPGLEEANLAREMELAAKLEMGSKHLPQLSATMLESQNERMMKQKMIEQALFKKDDLMESIMQDEYLENIPRPRIEKLVENVLRIAPTLAVDNPSIVLSVIRGAALTGADAIDVATANQLTQVERNYLMG